MRALQITILGNIITMVIAYKDILLLSVCLFYGVMDPRSVR